MDGCTKKWLFSKAYVVHLAESKVKKESSHELLKQGVIWCTDWSKNDKGWLQEHGEGTEPELDDFKNLPIIICSGSRATLMTQDSYLTTSKKVLKCMELLHELAVNNLSSLLWVSRHFELEQHTNSAVYWYAQLLSGWAKSLGKKEVQERWLLVLGLRQTKALIERYLQRAGWLVWASWTGRSWE